MKVDIISGQAEIQRNVFVILNTFMVTFTLDSLGYGPSELRPT